MGSSVIQYAFDISLSKPEENIYVNLKERMPLHPSESFARMWGRLFIYLHAYKEGLTLNKDIFDTKEPLASARGIAGEIFYWVERGSVERRKIERIQNHHSNAKISLYFDSEEEILKFCHELRGSKTNWIEGIIFYYFIPGDFEAIGDPGDRRHKLNATLFEPLFNLTSDHGELTVSVTPFNMWERYQESLG